MQLYAPAATEFRKRLLKGITPGLRETLLDARGEEAVADVLFPYFAEFVLANYSGEIAAYRCPHRPFPSLPPATSAARLAWPEIDFTTA